ncbi:MAG: cation:proton antiporter [Candidatus Omnitrophica bacterium]|nr:cation:proton antiporter [Candidatus Omnitrophota bacterium]
MINWGFILIIGGGILFCFLRMIKGPTPSDRAVALDTLSTVITAFLVVLGYIFKRYIYLDVSLVYAVLAFVGSVAIARFIEKGL